MKLTAYSIERSDGIWRVWPDVTSWQLSGSTLLVGHRDRRIESVALPAEVMGLADDGPNLWATAGGSPARRPHDDRRDDQRHRDTELTTPGRPTRDRY